MRLLLVPYRDEGSFCKTNLQTYRERNVAQQKDEELFGIKKPCIEDEKKT